MNTTINEAVKKLTDEANTVSGQNVPSIAIFKFLIETCSSDEDFSTKVIVDSKTLSKCFSYITEVAYRRASQQVTTPGAGQTVCIGLSSDEIFALAIEYFVLDDVELERRKKAEEEAAAERRKERAAAADQQRKDAAKKAAEAQPKRKQKVKKDTPPKPAIVEKGDGPDSQISLFDSSAQKEA